MWNLLEELTFLTVMARILWVWRAGTYKLSLTRKMSSQWVRMIIQLGSAEGASIDGRLIVCDPKKNGGCVLVCAQSWYLH